MPTENSKRIQDLISSLKPIFPPVETSTKTYPIKEVEERNALFLVSTSSTTKGGLDDDICELEERDSQNEVVRKYLYWSLADLSGQVSGGYKIV